MIDCVFQTTLCAHVCCRCMFVKVEGLLASGMFAPQLIIERTYARTWDKAVVTAVTLEAARLAIKTNAFSAGDEHV